MQKVKVQKWGDSYGIRIPKTTLNNLQIKDKSVLYMQESEDGIVLKKPSKKEELAELLAQFDENTQIEEIDWGESVGKEFR